MKNPGVIQVKKPLKWYNKKVKANFKKLIISSTKALISQVMGDTDVATKELVAAFDAFSFEEDPPGIAYILILKSMLNAMHDLSTENTFLFHFDFQNAEKFYDSDEYVKFLDNAENVFDNKELAISTDSLMHPKKISVVKDFCEYYKLWLTLFGVTEKDAEHLAARLPDYFVLEFHREWTNHPDKYGILSSKLDSPAAEDVKRIFEWKHYYAFLRAQVKQSVFNESFSLDEIYIPLRAYYTKKGKDKESGKEIEVKVAVDLETELNKWVATTKPEECIKIISGGPGSGKSTTAKIWTAKVLENPNIKVIFIPLHLFNLMDDFGSSLAKYIKTNVDIPLSYNDPVNDIDEKVLIIFDGLDELSKQGSYAEDIAKDFVNFIRNISNLKNRPNDINFLFLITGREIVIQSNKSEFRQKGQILHLLSYLIENKEDKHWENRKVLKQDQRDNWWKKYGQLTKQDYQALPQNLKELQKLNEITAQPLLNYLIALSLQRNKIEITTNTTLNAIYKDLVEGVFERGYHDQQHITLKGLEKNDFFRILEEIAISAWHGGDVRTTTIQKIEKHIASSGLKTLMERFKESAKKGISRLLVAFFFKEHHGIEYGEKTFEFTHKSFGEYLTASRLAKFIKKMNAQIEARKEDYDLGWDEKSALLEWLKITGNTALDDYIFNFLKDEIKSYELEKVASWQKSICQLLSYVLLKGMPFDERKSHLEETRLSRNAEEALFATHYCCAIYTQKLAEINFPNSISFGNSLSKLMGQRYGVENVIAYKSMGYLVLNRLTLYCRDLYGVNFGNSLMINCKMTFATLSFANLNYTNLRGANLNYAKLKGTNLNYAKLENARLENANLENARLENANLEIASLENARLENASLENANLQGANLQGANLQGANLQGANLQGANLQGANLQGANLQGANLQGAKRILYSQLTKTTSLKDCTGISKELLTKLKTKKPGLFE